MSTNRGLMPVVEASRPFQPGEAASKAFSVIVKSLRTFAYPSFPALVWSVRHFIADVTAMARRSREQGGVIMMIVMIIMTLMI